MSRVDGETPQQQSVTMHMHVHVSSPTHKAYAPLPHEVEPCLYCVSALFYLECLQY
jgi:hypothetical protein